MKLSKIHHVAIIGSDYTKSRDFYVNKLGLSVLRENYRPEKKDWKLDLQAGDCEIELFIVPDPPRRVTNPEACGLRHLAFQVDSVPDTAAQLRAVGIETEPVRTDPYTGGRFTFFRDPDDLPIEIHE